MTTFCQNLSELVLLSNYYKVHKIIPQKVV